MILAALLLLAAQQAGAPAAESNPKPAPWPDDVEFAEKGKLPEPAPAGLRAIRQFGACVVDASKTRSAEMLRSDFLTPAYRRAMDQLVEANRFCPFSRGWARMRASRLLLAGAMAERLIESDGTPLNRRLAKAALQPAAATYSVTDRGAMCVVRSAPDDVAKLFSTEVASAPEAVAAAPLRALFGRCMGGRPVEATTPALRSILATAAFRSVQTVGQAQARN